MRRILTLILFLAGSVTAHAATLTFEELAENTSGVPSVESQGFVFSG